MALITSSQNLPKDLLTSDLENALASEIIQNDKQA